MATGTEPRQRISDIKKRFTLDDFRVAGDRYYQSEPEPPKPATNLLVYGGDSNPTSTAGSIVKTPLTCQ